MKTIRTAKIYVTDVSDYVYCPRLFFMKKTMDIPRMETLAMHKGTIEHEIRRSAVKSIKAEYEACKDPYALKTIDYQSCIKGAIEYGLELARKIKSMYYLRLEEMTPTLQYRLEIEEKARLDDAIKMAKKGHSIREIIQTLLPWKQEIGVGSSELGVTGRIDELYKIGKKLIPLDFKTHSNRFNAFMWKESHQEQLKLYSTLLEMDYPGYKSDSAIIELTEDLHKEKFKVTRKDKANVKKHIQQIKDLIRIGEIPPKLSGPKAVKCSACYMRRVCFPIDKEGEQNC